MSSTLVLDARPLLQLCHSRKWQGISDWLVEIASSGRRIIVPEITDYEVRRLLLKRGASAQLRRLNDIGNETYYSPLTTELMRDAAQVWADAEGSGHRFGHPKTLNADAILIAQTRAIGDRRSVTVITKNTKPLDPFVNAVWWKKFDP